MKVKYDFLLKDSSIRHTNEIRIVSDKAYTFSKASQAVHNHIAKKYGWSSEEIIELNIKLIMEEE